MTRYTHKYLSIIFSAILASALVSCASSSKANSGNDSKESDASPDTAASASSDSGAAMDTVVAASTTDKDFAGNAIPETTSGSDENRFENVSDNIVEPIRVVESCKNEPYLKYENSARASIKKGWEATKEEKYGVGFRNAAEYEQWSNTHNTIFKRVSAACETLSTCASKHGKASKEKCAMEAESFRDWQGLASTFSKRVAEVEHAQVDKLCSLTPSLDDPSRCFDQLAENVNSVCKTDECKDLSQCWKNIYFMDAAIRQAESSCQFARKELSKCRGYTEQIGRRKEQLQRCGDLQRRINIDVLPAL